LPLRLCRRFIGRPIGSASFADLRDDGLSQAKRTSRLLATSGPATTALHRGPAQALDADEHPRIGSPIAAHHARGRCRRSRTFVITPTARGRRAATRVHQHLADLEQAVARRLTSADVKGFKNVIAAVEEEAHRRTRPRR
jgi:hypothetical protein